MPNPAAPPASIAPIRYPPALIASALVGGRALNGVLELTAWQLRSRVTRGKETFLPPGSRHDFPGPAASATISEGQPPPRLEEPRPERENPASGRRSGARPERLELARFGVHGGEAARLELLGDAEVHLLLSRYRPARLAPHPDQLAQAHAAELEDFEHVDHI